MKTIQHIMWGMAAASALALAGCSGGGSSSSSNNDDDGEQQTVDRVSLTGVAVKGVMANALITVTSLDDSTTYGTTRTNNQGRYSLANLALGSAPVKVTMTTDANTRLTCDSALGCDNNGTAVAFGQTYAFNDPGFALTSILPTAGNVTDIELMVTPVTHMAAERVAQAGVTNADDIEGINRATAGLLGLPNVDITRDIPLDITNVSASRMASEASRRYGALVASFSTIAAATGDSLDEVIDAVSDDYATDGGLIANASSDTTIDLELIFAAAADSASQAKEAGANLGSADLEFRANELLASRAPEDQEIIAQDTPVVPVEALTQAQAVDRAINLLEDMNEWNTAITGQSTENVTTAYQDQAQALTDLLPVVDDQSQVLRGLRELIVEETPQGDMQDGQLLKHIDLLDQLVDLASYIQSHHASLPAVDQGDGSYTLSAQSLLGNAPHLAIEQYLTDGSSGGILPSSTEADVTATYVLNDDDPERITQISFTGNNLISTLASSELTYALQDTTGIVYTLSNMNVQGSDGEAFSASGTLTMAFSSDTERQLFLNDRDVSGRTPSLVNLERTNTVLDASQTGLIGSSIDPDFEQATADLDITLNTSQSADQTVDIDLTVAVDLSTPQEGFLRGTLTTTAQGQHDESGSVTSGFSNNLELSDMDMTFTGALQARTQAKDTASFDGTVTLAGDNFEDNDPLRQSMTFDGKFGVQSAADASLTFEGEATLDMTALMAANGNPLSENGELLMVPEQVGLAGTLQQRSANGDATVNLFALIDLDGYDNLANLIAPITLPESGDKVAELQFEGFTETAFDPDANSATVTLAHNFSAASATVENYIAELGLTNPRYSQDAAFPEQVTFQLGNCVDETTNPGDTLRQCELSITTRSPTDIRSSVTVNLIVEQAIENTPSQWIDVVMKSSFQGGGVLFGVQSDEGYFDIGTNIVRNINDFGSADQPLVIDLNVQTVNLQLDADDIIEHVETEDIYRDISLVVDIDTQALNLEKGHIRLIMERLGLEDMAAQLRLSYGERHIDLTINSIDGLTNREATNLEIFDADTRMQITANCLMQQDPDELDIQPCSSGADFEGEVYVGDFKVGSLEDRSGFPVFTFDDPANRRYQLIFTPNFLVSEQP